MTVGLPTRLTLERLLMDTTVAPARLRRLIDRVAQLLRRLHGLGINHRDFYCGHIHVSDADDVFLVDLGRAEFRRAVPWLRRVKDLAAMDFSVPVRIVGARLRLRFLVTYLAGELGSRRRRLLLAAIAAKRRSFLRHSLRMIARGDRPLYRVTRLPASPFSHAQPLSRNENKPRNTAVSS